MNRFLVAVAIASTVLMPTVATAQIEEVVVTGSRMDDSTPHIFIVKRADHLITTVRVTCDTRDKTQRLSELRATLEGVVAAARSTKTISLGSTNDAIVGELDVSDLDDIVGPDSRPDTSQFSMVIKTSVSATDTFKSATGRIKDFMGKVTKVGRTEIVPNDRWDLTVIGPEQYRDRLITQIVADAKHSADLFGTGYGVTIEGLERPVTWSQKGALDLALYIPYSLHIAPTGH